jgi:hypothetical protein
MDKLDCLAHYPFVIVRIRCRVCARKASYRLARIAAKYGPEIPFATYWTAFPMIAHGARKLDLKKGKNNCGVLSA